MSLGTKTCFSESSFGLLFLTYYSTLNFQSFHVVLCGALLRFTDFLCSAVELETTQAKIGQDYPRWFHSSCNGLRWGSFCNLWRLSILPALGGCIQRPSCFILTVTFSVTNSTVSDVGNPSAAGRSWRILETEQSVNETPLQRACLWTFDSHVLLTW